MGDPKERTPTVEEDGSTTGTESLLSVRGLKKYFPVRRGVFARIREWVKAVDGVDFDIAPARTLGLVGESGCGKTTVGRTLLRLYEHTAGDVVFEGRHLFELDRRQMRAVRGRMQIIFQDPYGSLNPRMTVGGIVGEPLRIHRIARGAALRDRVAGLLQRVGLRPETINRYPHEFSGGQRQRIGIARALALGPAFIVCDEPTSALDVSIRAQILNLLAELQESEGISYLMISHDLAVVRHISHHVAVMYLGKIVELAPTDALYEDPRHPYTEILLSAIPVPDPTVRRTHLRPADGDGDSVPSPINIPSGCPFHPRCPLYQKKDKPRECVEQLPELRPLKEDPQHLVRCHFAEESRML